MILRTLPWRREAAVLSLFLVLSWFAGGACCAADPGTPRKSVRAAGACAVVGMSAEQSQRLALQRARAAAIEEAAGVAVSAASLVTDSVLAADFIRTFARGCIVKERICWLPLGQWQKDPSTPPIPEYRVEIVADVAIPERGPDFGLTAKLDRAVYASGDTARITVAAERPLRIFIFNLTADDRVALLFPNDFDKSNAVQPGSPLTVPSSTSSIELEMTTLPGRDRDTEAFVVVAAAESLTPSLEAAFSPVAPMELTDFFGRLARFGGGIQETILPYEVRAK